MAPLQSTQLSASALGGQVPSCAVAPSNATEEPCGGWQNINHLFVFGDSYSKTQFKPSGKQPSLENPIGNPAFPGKTSANGPNWVGFLTSEYRQSQLLAYNFAYGGATVDGDLVQYAPYIRSFKYQVETQFLPLYTGKLAKIRWTGADSIFAIWFGINDVNKGLHDCRRQNTKKKYPAHREEERDDADRDGFDKSNDSLDKAVELNDQILEQYSKMLDKIYDAGGRNFLFINVPPVDRSPQSIAEGSGFVDDMKHDIADWNKKLESTARSFKAGKEGKANVWVYDAHAVFSKVLDDPTSHAETRGLTSTTDASPTGEHFWGDGLHPNWPIHKVVGHGISETIAAAPNI